MNRRAISVATSAAPPTTVPVPMIYQAATNWCWAACVVMVARRYRIDRAKQCETARWLFGVPECCQPPLRSACNRGCMDSVVQRVYGHWSIGCTLTRGPLSFAAIEDELRRGRPIQVGFAWARGTGHVIIVHGCGRDASGEYVLVNDPSNGQGRLSYAELLAARRAGRWDCTWTGLSA